MIFAKLSLFYFLAQVQLSYKFQFLFNQMKLLNIGNILIANQVQCYGNNLKMENQYRLGSPLGGLKNKEKIRQIQQKLQSIAEAKANNTKDEKLTTALNRSTAIEKRSLEQAKAIENNIRESKEILKDYERNVDETIEKESYSLKNRNIQINELEKKVNDLLLREMQKTKEAEKRTITNYEEKIELLNSQMARQVEKRKTYFRDLDVSLSQNLPDLHGEVKNQLDKSSQQMKKLQEELNSTVELLHKEMEEAQNKHQESFEEFMRMMTQVIAEIKEEISMERESRIASKNKIVGLFEEAYAKLAPE